MKNDDSLWAFCIGWFVEVIFLVLTFSKVSAIISAITYHSFYVLQICWFIDIDVSPKKNPQKECSWWPVDVTVIWTNCNFPAKFLKLPGICDMLRRNARFRAKHYRTFYAYSDHPWMSLSDLQCSKKRKAQLRLLTTMCTIPWLFEFAMVPHATQRESKCVYTDSYRVVSIVKFSIVVH